MDQYNLSPLLPHREKVFALPFPTQYACLIQPANDLQDPYPTPCTLGIKGPLFNVGSPLSWLTVLTVSPTLINFISLSFCLMSGNSFPTRAQTMTSLVAHTGNLGSLPPPPHFSFFIGTLCEQASVVEATETLWLGLPSGVFQRPHCSLSPVAAARTGEGLCFVSFPTED